jgi:hypothetical protein
MPNVGRPEGIKEITAADAFSWTEQYLSLPDAALEAIRD